MLDNYSHYKGKRNKNKMRFMTYTDYIVNKTFNKDLMKLYGFTKFDSISNKLAALVRPKCLYFEIDHVMADIILFRNERDRS